MIEINNLNIDKKSLQIPSGQYPVLVFGGEVSLQTQSGKLVRITLSTHEISPNVHEYTNQELKDVINKNISLGRFRNAWAICQVKNKIQSEHKVRIKYNNSV